MLLRIFLILPIVAGLGAGGVAYYEFSTQIPALSKQRDDEKIAKDTEITAHNNTKKVLNQTKNDLVKTNEALVVMTSEKNTAVAKADAQSKRAEDLQVRLTKATSDLEEAQNQLASYKASDLTPDQVVSLNKNYKAAQANIATLKAEMGVLNRTLVATQARLSRYEGPDNFVKLKADLKGTILVVDPKWDFVVINIGDEQGAIQDGEMLVSRDGKLVAKVIIRSVQKDRAIANIVPGWKLGEIIEGDVVTPAHPAST